MGVFIDVPDELIPEFANKDFIDNVANDGIAGTLTAATLEIMAGGLKSLMVGQDLTARQLAMQIDRMTWAAGSRLAGEMVGAWQDIIRSTTDNKLKSNLNKAIAATTAKQAEMAAKAGEALNYFTGKSLGAAYFAAKVAAIYSDPKNKDKSESEITVDFQKEFLNYVVGYVAEEATAFTTFVEQGVFSGDGWASTWLRKTLSTPTRLASETAFGSRSLAMMARGGLVGVLASASFEAGWYVGEHYVATWVPPGANTPLGQLVTDGLESMFGYFGRNETWGTPYMTRLHPLVLAVSRLGVDLTPDEMNKLVFTSGKSPVYRPLDSQAEFLDALRVAVLGDVPRDLASSNDKFTQNVTQLLLALRGQDTLQIKVVGRDGLTAAGIGAVAQIEGAQNDAYRYALGALNPFVITGVDYGNRNTPKLWSAETDEGDATPEWLKDRAEMLDAKVRLGLANGGVSAGITKFYLDTPTSYTLGSNLLGVTEQIVFGGKDADTLFGSLNNDRIYGGAGGDTISGGTGDDYIEGNDGYDTIDAGMGDDEVHGGAGNDTIDGFTGDDKLYGGKGDDTINGGVGGDTIYGDKNDDPDSTTITGDDTIDGGSGNDKIWGGGGKDTIHGGDDADTIEGNAGDDTIYGDAGNDTIEGGDDNDTIRGGDGRDTIEGGDGDDIIYGGDGEAESTTFGNVLKGGDGNDKLYGDGGKDTIEGGDDNDLLVGNFGADDLQGGDGDDEIYGDLKDKDSPSGDNDQIDGGDGDDKLYGGGGRDLLQGGDGDDELHGGAGLDVLLGGDGDDELHGGKDVGDYMVGGAGHDRYVYANDDGADLIFDEDGDGEIVYDGRTLGHGTNKGKGQLEWYEGDPCDADFTYTASGNPDEGPVTLTIKSKAGGQLTVFNFQNGDLGIGLQDGDDNDCTKKPPPPPGGPGNQQRGDPLVLDLGSEGIGMFGLGQQLYFDLDSDGFAELVGWSGADEGMLVFDANGDGRLNDGQELFGDFTRLAGGQLATSGFQALSQHDRNHDGRIDALDPVWSSLRVGVWERDPFGRLVVGDPTTAMSLKSLDALGITSISLDSTIVTNSSTNLDTTSNVVTRTGNYTLADGTTRDIAEYRLARDNSDTKFTQYLPQPEANADDPSVVVGGQVMNLNQALVRDGDGGYLGKPVGALRAKLDALLAETQVGNYFARFEDLLFAWTGADAISPTASVNGLNARRAAVLEKTYGRSFQPQNADQASYWDTTYLELADAIYSSLLAETKFAQYIDAIDWQHSDATGKLFGNVSAVIALVDAELARDPVQGRALAIELGRVMRGLQLTRNTGYMAYREHFTNGGDPALGFEFDAVGKPRTGLDNYTQALVGGVLYGNGGDDVFYENQGQRLVGGARDNILVGDAGSQLLFGHEGDDLLDGGAGNDTLKGWSGNDTYVFRRGSGQDVIEETDGTDMVFFGSGIRREDLIVGMDAWNRATLRIRGTNDVLTFPIATSPANRNQNVEFFLFDDGTVLRFADLIAPTEGDDNIFGAEADDRFHALGGNDIVRGGLGDDTLDGGAGDDQLFGDDGNDLLLGGEGNDSLVGGTGNDVMDGGAGDDALSGSVASDPTRTAWYARAYGLTNGNDEYRFGFGGGHDTIEDFDVTAGNVDTLALGPDVRPEDVTLFAEGDNMVVQLASGDRITVLKHYVVDGSNAIERITFADGTVWDGDRLIDVTRVGTEAGDTLSAGPRGNSTLYGEGGNDLLYGNARADLLDGGDGDDLLVGAGGDDTLLGGAGNDNLNGGDGADVYDGGAGDDVLNEGGTFGWDAGSKDVFLYGRGDGNDVVLSPLLKNWWAPNIQQTDDVVRFKAGIRPEDVVATGSHSGPPYGASSSDIVFTIAGESGSLRVSGFFGGYTSVYAYTSTVRKAEFEDGTVWSFEDIANRTVQYGTESADWMQTGGWNDHVFALGGNDNVVAGDGNDTVDGGSGNDMVWGGTGDDTLLGGDGNDYLAGERGNDILDGGDGNDTLVGGDGDDMLTGGAGNDLLDAGAGNAVIDGGAGDDLIGTIQYGRLVDPTAWSVAPSVSGDVTMLFGRGDGHDTVLLANARGNSADTLRLKPGVARDDIALTRNGGDLVLTIRDTGDSVTMRRWFDSSYSPGGPVAAYRVETIEFGDGTHLDANDMRAMALVGGEGNDLLVGYADSDDLVVGNGGDDRLLGFDGNDVLVGGRGDDSLDGGDGNDVYVYAPGDGKDTITSFGGDAIAFGAGITAQDVLVRNQDGNLVLSLQDGGRIEVSYGFRDEVQPIGEVRFDDGTTWDYAALHTLALAGTAGDDRLEGFDTDDVLDGGAGNDDLRGGWGNDTYRFLPGSGSDTITDTGGYDALSFGGLAPSDVQFSLRGHDLVVEITATGEQVTVAGWANDYYVNDSIERFVFGGGADVLYVQNVLDLLGSDIGEVIYGTPDNDEIHGAGRASTIYGEEGDDVLFGGGGDDYLDGGQGDDALYGEDGSDSFDAGDGNDALYGGEGDDYLYGGEGDDRIEGGAGRDHVAGAGGSDTIVLGRGDGLDDVYADRMNSVFVRPGFDVAYGEARSELEYLRGLGDNYDGYYYQEIWGIEVDGGFAYGIPRDLIDRLMSFGEGVAPGYAISVLEELQDFLTTPLRPDSDGEMVTDYAQLEEEARLEFQAIVDGGRNNYRFTFWKNLDWDRNIPAEVFQPLVQLGGSDGMPRRQAELALQALLGWLNEVEPGDSGTMDSVYAEAVVELQEAKAASGEDLFYSNYWQSVPVGDADLSQRLQDLADGVPATTAAQTLADLKDWFLGRGAYAAGAGAGDIIEFGAGIELDDLEIATGLGGYSGEGGEGGYGGYGGEGGEGGGSGGNNGPVLELSIGIKATNDGLSISENGHDRYNWTAVQDLSVRRFRLHDGTVLTLEDILARADGRIGQQDGTGGDDTLKGSAEQDNIAGRDGDDIIIARGNDDTLRGQAGDDTLSAGAGADQADGGPGDDIIAGEKGNDFLRGGPGSDTFVFNDGDGDDFIGASASSEGDVDTLSFGVGITPDMVTASVDGEGNLVLHAGAGGSVTMPWFDPHAGMQASEQPVVRRVQFVDADGAIRIFDLAALVASRSATLGASTSTVALFADASAFELTGHVAPAGGHRAVAYAQTGDLFADPYYAHPAATDGADVLIGTPGDDTIDGGDGNDVIAAGSGNDVLYGGAGDDILTGGAGYDDIHAGPGNDTAAGGEGDDWYYFNVGDGTLTIDDDGFAGGPNQVLFGPGIARDDVRLSYEEGYLVLDTGTPGDRVRLSRFDPQDPFGTRAVSSFQFDGEDPITYEDLLERGFDLAGTPGDDQLSGTPIADRITGFSGDDFIVGGAGNDVLDGGPGSDTYVFNLFDGYDLLFDRESDTDHNVLQFGEGIDASSIRAYVSGGLLYLNYGAYDDTVLVRDVDPGNPLFGLPFDEMRFDDGSVLMLSDLFAAGMGFYGTPGADVLTGAQGDDFFFGEESDDVLAGGAGNDTYFVTEGGGSDTIVDVSDDTQSNTVTFLHSAALSLDDFTATFDRDAGTLTVRVNGTSDGVVLAGFDADDPYGRRAVDTFFVDFGAASFRYEDLVARGFQLFGTEGADLLRGSAAHDEIFGLDGDDILAGGPGNDVVDGGAGNDTYLFNRGDGTLTIRDEISRAPQNVLDFGPGITVADLRNNLRFEAADEAAGLPGVLRIGLGDGDEVRIEGFDADDPDNGAHAVERYAFADGTVLSYTELVRNTFIVQGDTGDDLLQGTNVQDRLYGFEGNDELYARDGNDTLTGGTGDDLLFGGEGADMYVFHAGDGNDVIFDSGDNYDGNFISFAADVDPATIGMYQDGGDMVVTYGAGDSVRIAGWDPSHPAIREIRLGNDPLTAFTIDSLQNLAPEAGAALADQSVLEDQALFYQLPEDAFGDPDGGSLAYHATLAGGNALPAWLAFDPTTRTFSGTPENVDVGTVEVEVTASDAYGARASQSFVLTVVDTNDAPVLVSPVANQLATQGQAFELQLPVRQFVDPDAGDTLAFSVSLANGDPLPSWLSFDAATGTLRGTPANTDVGTLAFRVTATDTRGASASDAFALTIQDAPDAPVVAAGIADQAAIEDAEFSFTVPAGTFADPDAGDALSTFATLANGDPLPSWLFYDAATMTFRGTPLNEDVGGLAVSVYAVDRSGLMVAASFDLVVANTNDAPGAEQDFGQVSEDGAATASGNVLDNDSDVDTGTTLAVAGPGTFTGLYGTLTLNADGSYLYTLDNDLVQFLGEDEQAADVFGYDVTDGIVSTQGALEILVNGSNDAPLALADAATLGEDDLASLTGNVLQNDTDPDALDLLGVAAPGVYAGAYGTLTIGEEGTYSYSLDNAAVQSLGEGEFAVETFSYGMTDGRAGDSAVLSITISGANDAPVAANAIDGQSATEDAAFSFTLPADTFTDVDAGDALTYSASVAGGGALPAWLVFDANLRTFRGTPANGDVGMLNVVVTATDTHGASVAAGFTIAVGNVNDNPVAVVDSAATSEDGIVSASGNVLANDYDIDAGEDPLVVQNPGTFAGTYGSLTLSADGSYVYTLANGSAAVQRLRQGEVVTDVFAYGASDGEGVTTSTLTITVTGTNDAPVVVADLANVREDVATVASGKVLANDSDADRGTTLSVANAGTYTGNYGVLTLNADGSYSYALDNGSAAVQSLRAGEQVQDAFAYTASDGIAGTASTLTVTVSGTNDAPVTAADVASVSEDGTLVASGNVLGNDSDADHGTTLAVANAGTFAGSYGTLALNADGSYSYVLANASSAVQALTAGQQVQDTFTYTATDGITTVPSTLVVTISGSNDVPGATADTALVVEDTTLTAAGNVLANDVDADQGATLSLTNAGTYAGTYGTLTLGSNGSYGYALDNGSAAVQALRAGQTVSEVFGYVVSDGTVQAAGTLTIAIAGSNDSPVTAPDAAAVSEDGVLGATGNVLANDRDADAGTTLTVAAPGTYAGTYGTLTLAADGSYAYALDNGSAAVQGLRAGQSASDVFTYRASDGIAQSTGTLAVTVTGSGDAPSTTADTAAASEDGQLAAVGNVLANDRDADSGTTLTVANAGSYAGTYGVLTLGADGQYRYALANDSAAVQALRAGQTVNDVFTYVASDGTQQAQGTLTVAIAGANDVPVTVADSGAVAEDGVQVVSGNVLANDSDVDAGTALSVASAGTYTSAWGTLVINASGAYTYTLNNASAAVQGLRAGQSVNDVFSYTATDGQATRTGTLSLAIAGTNDAPVPSAPLPDRTTNAGQAVSFTVAANTFTDADQGDVLTYAASQASGAALPSWLSFDAATRTFSGTPGNTDAGSLTVRVRATDASGAAAVDDFTLTVAAQAGGQLIVGTDGNDVLVGTPYDDVIDGREGYDVMAGGKGNDSYFVDRTGDDIDKVVENPNEGYDTVYALTDYTAPANLEEVRLLGCDNLDAAGNALANTLVGNSGRNTLLAGAGDDTLEGGEGNDALSGGVGSDTYVYSPHDGDDLIDDKGASGQVDTLKLQGMGAGTVRVNKAGNDLVVDFPGRDGRVTVRNWFASSASRVERFQFDDGTVWDEAAIRSRVGKRVDAVFDAPPPLHGNRDDDNAQHGTSWWNNDRGRDPHDDDGRRRDGVDEAIGRRLAQPMRFGFDEVTRALGDGTDMRMTAQQIARRWASVQGYTCAQDGCNDGSLQHDADMAAIRKLFGVPEPSPCGFGYAGSMGDRPAAQGFQVFQGLVDGLKKL